MQQDLLRLRQPFHVPSEILPDEMNSREFPRFEVTLEGQLGHMVSVFYILYCNSMPLALVVC